ncbi:MULTISPECIES: hypothetical protein [unclassified Nonomuraea]|uniref:hypothetical protein n=1 Tax=unclassified Nonomuraea TaxID=2593643 RepID=UPI00344AC0F8
MYRQRLILAGLVGGLLMSGGAAFANDDETEINQDRAHAPQSSLRSVDICSNGDLTLAGGDVNQGTEGVLVLETGDILSQILGIKKEERNCSIG